MFEGLLELEDVLVEAMVGEEVVDATGLLEYVGVGDEQGGLLVVQLE